MRQTPVCRAIFYPSNLDIYPIVLYNKSMKVNKPSLKLPKLSVFFPLYNEEPNVEKLIAESLKVFPKVAEKFEIVLVNDGSRDKTREIAKKLEAKYPPVRLVSQRNKGY